MAEDLDMNHPPRTNDFAEDYDETDDDSDYVDMTGTAEQKYVAEEEMLDIVPLPDRLGSKCAFILINFRKINLTNSLFIELDLGFMRTNSVGGYCSCTRSEIMDACRSSVPPRALPVQQDEDYDYSTTEEYGSVRTIRTPARTNDMFAMPVHQSNGGTPLHAIGTKCWHAICAGLWVSNILSFSALALVVGFYFYG